MFFGVKVFLLFFPRKLNSIQKKLETWKKHKDIVLTEYQKNYRLNYIILIKVSFEVLNIFFTHLKTVLMTFSVPEMKKTEKIELV